MTKMDEGVNRQRAELEELRARVVTLATAEERARVLYEHSSDAHLIFDQRGIIDCNAATIAILHGRDKSQVLAIHPAVLSPERQPDGRSSHEKSVEMDRLARERGFHRFEWMHRRLTGEDFPVEVTLTPIELQEGPAVLVVWHDLTEIKAREAALRAHIATIAEQQARIRALSMPIIEVLQGVVMVPIFGELDAATIDEMTGRVLEALAARRSWALILDVTALAAADGETPAHLLMLLRAARLLGTEGFLVGISPALAQAMARSENTLEEVRVLASLREAIERCQRLRR
jgi:PAS domain S-box-containing protein